MINKKSLIIKKRRAFLEVPRFFISFIGFKYKHYAKFKIGEKRLSIDDQKNLLTKFRTV